MKAVALICLALLAAASAQNTFCQRYSAALFGSSTAATQTTLLTAVITGVVVGRQQGYMQVNTTGLINAPLNKPYFNGQKAPMIDYTAAANKAQFDELALHLIQFFGQALGCVEFAATNSYSITAESIKAKHVAMAITLPVYTEFVAQIVNCLVGYGVPGLTGANDDLAGPAALLGKFLKGSPAEICSDATCPEYNDYLHFMTDADTFWVMGDAAKKSEGKLLPGGAVHFDLTAMDNVVEAADATAVTLKTGGLTSGAVGATRSYTIKLSTVGTYYFYSAKAPATKRASVVVALSSAASTPVSFLAVALAAAIALFAQRV